MTWREAEEQAAQHMRSMGFPNPHVTANGSDGGIDVDSSGAIAQVKLHSAPVGRHMIQQLVGRHEAQRPDHR